jgi:nitrite reductase (NO-forming)
MKAHHLTSRLWFAGALLAVMLPEPFRLGWWLPVHMLLLGAASQLIVGGQTMFSTTLAMAPRVASVHVLGPLVLVNLGAGAIAVGRVFGFIPMVAAGAGTFLSGTGWASKAADRQWGRGLGSRFRVTRSFYRAAGVSILVGGSVGATLALDWLPGDDFLSHRLTHMAFNLFGWTAMTIVGTAITLLPAVLRVRAAYVQGLRWAPWAMFTGILSIALGLTLGSAPLATVGGVTLLAGLIPFARLLVNVAVSPRRFPVPVAGLHLLAAILWLAVVMAGQLWPLATGDKAVIHDLWLVGLAGGVVVQAILGAWSFLLPMEQPVGGEWRRRHLVAFELGARMQVAAYNLGLVLLLFSLQGVGFVGGQTVALWLIWAAAAWGLAKACFFKALARLPIVGERSKDWWEPKRTRK